MAAIALKRGGSVSSASGSSEFGGSHGSGGLLSGGGGPTVGGASPGAGLYGTTLASLEYQEPPRRRHSLARNESQSTLGDDLSLKGECDVSSIRSDRHRPGRRASLSAAIELTRSPQPKRSAPKRATSGTRSFGGRRNSLFGNSGSKDRESAAESLAKLANKKSGSRRASMAGYPAATSTVEEPEPTPQFFHSRKKDKISRHLPNRRKSTSFDKNDPRAVQITSQVRPGSKIKRPGKGSRRASMSNMPGRLTKSHSKSSNNSKGSNRSLFSSSSGASSSYDISDDDDCYGYSANNKGKGTAFRRTTTMPSPKRSPAPQRSSSYGAARTKKELQKEDLDLGYGDPQHYDPQLPPPPPPGANKQKGFINRRGSTGTAVSSFPTTTAAQRSLKESFQWKASSGGVFHRSSMKTQRRGSTASSVANSVATDVVNNTQGRRVPADVPPSPRVPADIPPGGRRVPADVPPGGRRVPVDLPPGKRVPVDLPPPPATPQKGDKPKLSMMNGPNTPMGDDSHSENSYNYQDSTPLQSNRRIRGHNDSSQNISTMGNHNSALGLMSDESDGSHGDSSSALSMMSSSRRRASRGLSVLAATGTPAAAAAQASSLGVLAGSSVSGFNPYGSSRNHESDYEEDDEEEETEEEQLQNQKMADFGSEAGDHVVPSAASTTDSALTQGSLTPTEETMDLEQKKKDDGDNTKDDDSVDSTTSEAPQEKAPESVDVDELASSRKQTPGLMDEIGATGDWSGGVQEHLRTSTTNSLLDRYPGSDYDEGAEVGYGYSHLGQQTKLLNACDEESEQKDDYDFDNGYGPSDLYDEDYSSFGWREHRPRAADSIEFINMEQLMSKAKNTKGLYLPTFIPAHGCTNASDFIVRCFVARLRAGMTVTKHSRSRFCKSHDRILHILPTGYHITWIPEIEEAVVEKSRKKPPTKLDLTKCLEVRHAWSRDPKSMRYTGTSTLRSKCKEGAANRSFALIYPHRTVDFTAATVDQCKILMEGFSALCFRLQMARLEQQSGDDNTQNSGISGMAPDNDSTTASLTGTTMSAPWGL